MRRINLKFLESVKGVSLDEKLNSNYFELLSEKFNELKIQEIIGNSDLISMCYELFENELPFIKEYYVYDKYPVYPEKIVEESEVLMTAMFIELINSKVTKITDVKSLLPILITYRFLNLNYNDYNLIQKIDLQLLQHLKNELVGIVKSMKFSISKNHGTYSDLQFIKSYEEGTKTSNINLIYEFVEAIERGIGFQTPAFIREVVTFLLFLDVELLVEGLNEKEQVVEIILLMGEIEFEVKVEVLTQSNLKNKWCLYELFRQILNESKKVHLSDDLLRKLSRVILRIAVYDINFYKKIIATSKYDGNFLLTFANTINHLEKNLIDVFVETIQIDKYSNDLEINRKFVTHLMDEGLEDNILYLLEKIYFNWIAYLDELYEKGDYISDLVYTDYYYCVVQYLLETLNEDEIYEELTKIIRYFEYIETTWKKDSTIEQSHFFIALTRLYTLSIIFKEKDLSILTNNHLYKEIKKYIINNKMWLRFFANIEIPKIIIAILSNLGIKSSI